MNVLGKISLIFSLMCFLLTAGFRLALSGWIPFIGWGLLFALFFLLFAIAINFRFVLGLLKSESLQFLSRSVFLIMLVLGIFGALNFILYKKNITVDLTQNKIHSLSDLTQALVKAIPEPLTFHYFHVDNAKVRGYERQVREYLQPYLRQNSKLKVESHSVFKNPDLAKRFRTGNEESSLYVEYKNRIERVADLSEMSVTNALLKVTQKPKKVYFLHAFEARQINDASTFGLQGIQQQLERLHYKVDSLETLDQLPEDLAVLVVVGPRAAISDQDQAKLDNFLQAGGALLLALDPGEEHGLNALLKNYHLEFTDRFVYTDDVQTGQSDLLVLAHNADLEHEMARSLSPGENPMLFIASTLGISNEANEDMRVYPVLEHLPTNKSRKDIAPGSAVVGQGRQTAAALVEGQKQNRFRLAVVADSDFMTNQFYSQPANFTFFLGLITYLSKDEDLLKMRPPVPETTFLIMTQTQMNLYFLFFILPFSLLFFVLALFFKLRRFF